MTSAASYSEFRYRSEASPSDTHAYLEAPVRSALGGARGNLLDVGCGNGAFSKRLRSPERRVFGCELSETGVRYARDNLDGAVLAGADADFRSLFAGIERWDAILSTEVIEHLYAPRAFVRRAREALKPGGALILTTPYHGYAKNLAIALAGKCDRHWDPLWDGGHIKFWSRRTLTQLLADEGFQVEGFWGAGRLPYLWKSMVLRATPKSR